MTKSHSAQKSTEALAVELSPEAMVEAQELGILDPKTHREGIDPVKGRPLIPRRAIKAHDVLNEAYDYALPSSFSRGLRVELPGATMLLLSGTASVDENGATVYPDDFKAQCLRTYRNLTRLLVAEGASWHDVVRTTCYLRDIERDYDTFNKMRTMFLNSVGADPLPASTGIQTRLCRSNLLVEMEAMAIIPHQET